MKKRLAEAQEAAMDLSKARILVTGGSRGIGKETARQLRARGAAVAISGRDADTLKAAGEELDCATIQGDVGEPDAAAAMVAGALEALGGYDVLVNNAALGSFAPLVDTDPNDMLRVWRVNVLGAFLVAQASARHFVEHGGGTILNVGSTAARKGFAGGTAYASSKFALSAMTECWRDELRKHDVRVMQVNPSAVQTEFGGSQPDFNDTRLQSADIAGMIVAMLEMPDRGFVTETTIWATNPR